MLADRPPVAIAPPEHAVPARDRPSRTPNQSVLVARAGAFVGVFGLVMVYALRGGSYDVVVFEEHGLVIWWVLAIGIALGLLPRSRPSRPALLLLGALLAYALWTGLSLTWTQSSERTTQELARVLDYTGLVALIGSTVDRSTWRAAAAGLGFAALVVCVLAVGSRLAPSIFPVDTVDRTLHISRLSYPLGYWNAVGAWATMSTAIGLAWSAHDPSRIRRAVTLALVPVASVTTYLTSSRAGVVGTGLAVLAVVALSRNRFTALIHAAVAGVGAAIAIMAVRGAPAVAHAMGTRGAAGVWEALIVAALLCGAAALLASVLRTDSWRLPRAVARPFFAACVIAVLVGGAVFGPRLAERGWHSFTRTTAVASTDPAVRLASGLSGTRYPLWKATLKEFDAHPVNGTGAGTLEFWWNRHATNAEFIRDAHNIWLQNMGELGTPGLLLIVAVALSAVALGASVRRRVRRSASAGASAALLAAFIVYLLHASVDWMWESTAVTVLALGAVAVLGARRSSAMSPLRWRARSVLVLTATVAGLIQLPGLISTTAIRRSQAAERTGNAQLALAWANVATMGEPWSASAYEQRGLVLETADRLTGAEHDLRRAVSHESTNFRHWLILSRIETELSQLAAATRDYDRAHQLRPRATVFALAPYFSGGHP